MTKPKIIGLTGGIGSGKSTIAKIFESLGYAVYNSDTRAKEFYKDVELINRIEKQLAISITEKGVFNKKKLANIIFNHPKKLQELNAIIHPLVKLDFEDWLIKNKDKKYVIKESALLFETSFYKDCFKTILVTAPIETRISRVMQRDSISRQEVLSRINNQWLDEEKEPLADFIILNIDLKEVEEKINEIVKILKNL